MRTDAEIVARISAIESHDVFGFEANDLLECLSFEAAKPFLKDTATAEQWGEIKPRDRDSVISRLRDYMPFAWNKANNCRGISAARSLCHMRAWLWLAAEDDFLRQHDLLDYDMYGKRHLVAICEHYSIDWRALDNGRWRDDEGDPGISADVAMAGSGGHG